ncbi:hypothetical protein Tco_0385426 [Tanacetum coccineum]
MGGSSSQRQNTGYWQEPNSEESLVKAVATSPPKTKKPTRARQNRMIQSDDAPRQIAWTHEDEIALAKGWVDVSENSKYGNSRKEAGFCNDEDEVQEIRRPMGRDKARDATKKKGSRASGSSSMNDVALARLMVTEMTAQEKEQRDAFLEIKRREVECCELEIAAHEYRQRQEDIKFYLQPYDHLTGEQRMAMDEARAEIKAKYKLLY